MPGPVSDSYDPEFGTAANADEVREALEAVKLKLTAAIGSPGLRYVLDVAREADGEAKAVSWSERELRLLRYALNTALECI